MCDPCGVECVLAWYRGRLPTAIHVLSLRDNRGQCAESPQPDGADNWAFPTRTVLLPQIMNVVIMTCESRTPDIGVLKMSAFSS